MRDIITVFKAMLSYAQEEYGFKLSLKNVVLPKVEKKQIARISDTEQKRLTDYLKANITLTAFGILLSLCMGWHIGELCGLKWEDVDFKHKILHIRRTVQRITSANGNRKTKIVISAPKSATSFRDIAIPESLMRYPRKYITTPTKPVQHHKPQRGDIWFADLGSHPDSSVQSGCRPVIVISNNIRMEKGYLPTHPRDGRTDEVDTEAWYDFYIGICRLPGENQPCQLDSSITFIVVNSDADDNENMYGIELTADEQSVVLDGD